MKFLITGDLQIHPWRQFSYTRKSGMNSRLYNCLKVFDVLLEEAQKRDITQILLNGDLFEANDYIDVEVFDATYLKLEKLHSEGMEVVVNLGNHDVAKQSGKRILHALRAFRKVARIIEEPTLVWKNLWVVPWDVSPETIKEGIRSFGRTPSTRYSEISNTVLVGHFGVQGAQTGPAHYVPKNAIVLKDLRANQFGLVLLSDYHTRQRLAPNVFYLGSPLQHSFGEIHRPCVWAVRLDREGIFRTEKVYTQFPQFRRWDSRTSSLRDLQKDSTDYFRIHVRDGSVEERTIQKLSEKYGFRFQISIGDDREEMDTGPICTSGITNTNRAFRQYVRREVKSENSRRRLLKLGQKLYKGEL